MAASSKTSRMMLTVKRKLSKSVAQRGILETVVRCFTRPMRYAHTIMLERTPAWRKLRRKEKEWDQQFDVDTCPEVDAGWMSEIDSPNWEHGRGYHPAPTESLTARLAELGIAYEDFIFIDFGSGKGRSLLIAAQFNFKKVIGVEFSAILHETAQRNVASYRNADQKCKNIEPVHSDAACYPIPSDPAVYYFYDPFGEPVMRKVVDRIFASLKDHPRKVYVVYFNPVFAEMFDESDQFVRRGAGKEFMKYWGKTLDGDKTVNEFESELLDGERYVIYESILNTIE